MGWNIAYFEEKWVLRGGREKLGLTQQEVADKAKIQLRQYQRFESGERNLSSSSFSIACRVLKVLGLDPKTYHEGGYAIGDEVYLSKEGLRRTSDHSLFASSTAENEK